MKKIMNLVPESMILLAPSPSLNVTKDVAITGRYAIDVAGYDWGCVTRTITLTLSNPIDNINVDTFKVTEHFEAFNFETLAIEPKTVIREVASVVVDEDKVLLTLTVFPNVSSPIVWSFVSQYNTYCKDYYFEITLNDKNATSNGLVVSSLNIEHDYTAKTTAADNFKLASYQAKDGVAYDYVTFTPENASNVLVVWLHGLGEGGSNDSNNANRTTDPFVTILANKVTALAQDNFQSIIGGAYILAPQCPTYWMDKDGKHTNFNKGAIKADGTSFYQESLHELIAYYKQLINADKVIIAGCSNGGYMTLLMGMAYPDEYDAIIPICEAINDRDITDQQLMGIKDLPMYFIYSNDDTTVDPKLHEVPTIKRLNKLGASQLHVSISDHVVDLSGLYHDEEGNPYQYIGHWSWIYFFNNQSKCHQCHQSVFDFIKEVVNK